MARSHRISYDENGNMLVEGIKIGIKEMTFDLTDIFSREIKNLDLQLKGKAIDENTYYKLMEKLRNEYLEKGTKEWWQYTYKLIDYDEKLLKEAEKEAERLAKEAEKLANEEQKEEERLAKEQQKEAERLAKEAEKQAKAEQKEAEKLAKAEQKEAERLAKEAEKQAKAEQKEAERLAKEAEKQRIKQQKEAERQAKEIARKAIEAARQEREGHEEAKRQSEAFRKIQNEAKEAAEKEKNEIKKNFEAQRKLVVDTYSQIAETIFQNSEELAREQLAFAEKLKGVTSEYKSKKIVFVGQGERGSDLTVTESSLEDLKAQTESLKDYYKLLTAVNERGVGFFGEEGFRDFFEMLRGLSVDESVNLAALLLKEDDEGFSDFVGEWNELQSTIKDFSQNIYKNDAERLYDESFSYMERVLREKGLIVPEGFFVSGKLAAGQFGSGFMSEIGSVLDSIANEFDMLMPKNDVEQSEESYSKNTVFSPVYHLYGSGETISEKLRSAMSQALVEKLRGGY